MLPLVLLVCSTTALHAQLYVKNQDGTVVDLSAFKDNQFIQVEPAGLLSNSHVTVILTDTSATKGYKRLSVVTDQTGKTFYRERSVLNLANYLYPRGWAYHSAVVRESVGAVYYFERRQ